MMHGQKNIKIMGVYLSWSILNYSIELKNRKL